MHAIKFKITIFTVLSTLIITVFSASAVFSTFSSQLTRSLVQSTEFNLQLAVNTMTDSFNTICSLTMWANTNSAIHTFLSTNKSIIKTEKLEAFKRLNEEYQNCKAKDYITRLMVGATDGRFVQIIKSVLDGSSKDYEHTVGQYFFDDLLAASDYKWIGIIEDPMASVSSSNRQVIPILRPIYSSYNSNAVGWIYISVSAKLITDALAQCNVPDDSQLILTINDESYVYQNGMLSPKKMTDLSAKKLSYPTLYSGTLTYQVTLPSQVTYTYVTYPSSISGITLSQSLSHSQLSTQKTAYHSIIIAICLAILSVGILLTLYLNHVINRPIRRILRKVQAISAGDFSYDDSIEMPNEFGIIGESINELSQNVVELMDKRIADEKHQKELEYQILQSQINPHFLYNTLNSIKMMATIQNATGIPEMTTALSRLLKSIAKRRRQMVPLREEIDLLKNYLIIQEYRYGGTVSVDFDIEVEELLEQEVPVFTLQPLVENAIFHGIEAKGSCGKIQITIQPFEDDMKIIIHDNGIGMSAKLIQQTLTQNTGNEHTFFQKLGIHNVDSRIKYAYGDRYGISIRSEVGTFTEMILLLPQREKGDNDNDPTTDRR